MKLYLITINDDDNMINYREIDLYTAVYVISSRTNTPYNDIISRISNYGITYWYENDEYFDQSCLINVEHHNLNFNGSYDRLMYSQLIGSLREEKFKTLGI
jgi:hypothetical protein